MKKKDDSDSKRNALQSKSQIHDPRSILFPCSNLYQALFRVSRLASRVSCLASHVSRLTSRVSRLTSRVSRFASRVSRYSSRLCILLN
jgi:hypothetical protein